MMWVQAKALRQDPQLLRQLVKSRATTAPSPQVHADMAMRGPSTRSSGVAVHANSINTYLDSWLTLQESSCRSRHPLLRRNIFSGVKLGNLLMLSGSR